MLSPLLAYEPRHEETPRTEALMDGAFSYVNIALCSRIYCTVEEEAEEEEERPRVNR